MMIKVLHSKHGLGGRSFGALRMATGAGKHIDTVFGAMLPSQPDISLMSLEEGLL